LTTAAGAATAAAYNYFTTGQSSSKLAADTNLDSSCKLSPPNVFSVMAVGFIFAPTMLFADVANVIKNYSHFFTIGSNRKAFTEGPLHLYPGGVGISAALATNHGTTALLQAVNVGTPDLNIVRRFPDWPRDIPPGVAFRVEVSGTTFTLAAAVASTIVSPAYGGYDVMTYLDGIRDKEVS
jgi:hypothetical protein